MVIDGNKTECPVIESGGKCSYDDGLCHWNSCTALNNLLENRLTLYRTCVACEKLIEFDEYHMQNCKKPNPILTFMQAMKIWNSKHIVLVCCACFSAIRDGVLDLDELEEYMRGK